ncbi:MAG: hypothetical protein BGN88_05330 [Clostridiales bacterium 43-6]|nr:MAG: hypothetical protein BGN88_05330 [Clostridiales bacterium 43-6]
MNKITKRSDLINRKKKKGFTLIELIVVIAILGILAAILVPSMLGILNQAHGSTDNANARAIYSASVAAASRLSAANKTVDDTTVENEALLILGAGFDGDTFVVNVDEATGAVTGITYTPPGGTRDPINYPTEEATTTA